MSPKDRVTQINEQLNYLKKYLKFLKQHEKISEKELVNDELKRGAIERYLQLAIETVLDIASQLIAEFRYRTPKDYADSIVILGEEKVLPKKFAEQFSNVARFRNILVHDYIEIDYKKVADKLNNHLGDFEEFAKAVAKYLS